MQKKDSAEGFYDDGLWYMFPKTKVHHLHVELFTATPDAETFPSGYETCDLRLSTVMPKAEWNLANPPKQLTEDE